MNVVVEGRRPPGRVCGPYANVHVALQIGPHPVGIVSASTQHPVWSTAVKVVDVDGLLDFRGPAVHGKRGDRFLYLTWGEVDQNDSFVMFRRAKLMLSRVDPELILAAAEQDTTLVADVDLTDNRGMPRCARVDPPAINWRVQPATSPHSHSIDEENGR